MIAKNEPMAVVQTYADGFNRGDINAMAALFDEEGTILDVTHSPRLAGHERLPGLVSRCDGCRRTRGR
jgi:hypothetical protein